jgi:hypothetical protein
VSVTAVATAASVAEAAAAAEVEATAAAEVADAAAAEDEAAAIDARSALGATKNGRSVSYQLHRPCPSPCLSLLKACLWLLVPCTE